jgi:large conductance mechanosensitive channel
MRKLWDEFKKFIMEGDLVALAVAFILGVTFKQVVDAFVNDVINPIFGAMGGQPNFNDLTFSIGEGVFRYGHLLGVIINFLITGAVLFVIVKAYEYPKGMRTYAEKEADPTEAELLTQIRDELRARN